MPKTRGRIVRNDIYMCCNLLLMQWLHNFYVNMRLTFLEVLNSRCSLRYLLWETVSSYSLNFFHFQLSVYRFSLVVTVQIQPLDFDIFKSLYSENTHSSKFKFLFNFSLSFCYLLNEYILLHDKLLLTITKILIPVFNNALLNLQY